MYNNDATCHLRRSIGVCNNHYIFIRGIGSFVSFYPRKLRRIDPACRFQING